VYIQLWSIDAMHFLCVDININYDIATANWVFKDKYTAPITF